MPSMSTCSPLMKMVLPISTGSRSIASPKHPFSGQGDDLEEGGGIRVGLHPDDGAGTVAGGGHVALQDRPGDPRSSSTSHSAWSKAIFFIDPLRPSWVRRQKPMPRAM